MDFSPLDEEFERASTISQPKVVYVVALFSIHFPQKEQALCDCVRTDTQSQDHRHF